MSMSSSSATIPVTPMTSNGKSYVAVKSPLDAALTAHRCAFNPPSLTFFKSKFEKHYASFTAFMFLSKRFSACIMNELLIFSNTFQVNGFKKNDR